MITETTDLNAGLKEGQSLDGKGGHSSTHAAPSEFSDPLRQVENMFDKHELETMTPPAHEASNPHSKQWSSSTSYVKGAGFEYLAETEFHLELIGKAFELVLQHKVSRRIPPLDKPIHDHPKSDEILEIAREEGYTEPCDRTIENACRLFDVIPDDLPCEPLIYPAQSGDVYVKALNKYGDHVTFIVQPDDSILHSFKIDNFEEHSNMESIDEDFVTRTFNALKHWDFGSK